MINLGSLSVATDPSTPSPAPSTGASTGRATPSPTPGSAGVSVSVQPTPSVAERNASVAAALGVSMGDYPDQESINPLPDAPQSRLNLNVAIDNYNPVDSMGMSEQRPEIVAEFNFEPVYDDDNANSSRRRAGPVGEMLDIQMSGRQLRADNITRLINELRADPDALKTIQTLEARLAQSELDVEDEVKFLQELVQKLTDARRALSVKNNVAFITADVASRGIISTDPVLDVIVNVLGFTNQGYNSFTDTKILAQMIEDLRVMIKTYSPSLIETTDTRRRIDFDPFTILKPNDTTPSILNSFDASTLASRTSADLASILDRSSVELFNNSIRQFSNLDERMRMIFAVLSKELRISAGLSEPRVRSTIEQTFGIDRTQIDRNIFDRIIGEPGATIFDAPSGQPNSIASLILNAPQNVASNRIVLPFESNFIKRSLVQVIPGQKFYVDSITKGTKKLDATPLNNYATAFGQATQSLAVIIEATLDVNAVNSDSLGLNAATLLDRFLRLMHSVVDEISTRSPGPEAFYTDLHPADKRDTFTPALLHAAADDPLLKHMLVLYIMHAGMTADHRPGVSRGLFRSMAQATQLIGGAKDASGNPIDPTTNITAAIINVLQSVDNNPLSAYGVAQRGNDVERLLTIANRLVNNTIPVNQASGFDIICAAMTARLLDLQATGNRPLSYNHGNELYDDISEYRIFDKLSNLGDTDPAFILRNMIDFISSIDRAARNAVSGGASSATAPDYFSDIIAGTTRLNGIGAHTIILMVVELFTSFFKMFPVATFRGADTVAGRSGKVFSVLRDDELVGVLKEALGRLLPSPGLNRSSGPNILIQLTGTTHQDREARVQDIVSRFSSMETRFGAEDATIKKITSVLLAIGNSVKMEGEAVARFFDPRGPNASQLAKVLASSDANEKLAALDSAQVALARNTLAEHRAARTAGSATAFGSTTASDTSTSPFIDDTVIPASVRSALFSMLRSSKFISPGANNIRLLSVGLPAGFSDALRSQNSSFFAGQDLSELAKKQKLQSDVIHVNVYMKDLLFDDVVFKPQTFVFQTGRFVAASDFGDVRQNDTRTFETLVNEAIQTRALTADGTRFNIEKGPSTATDASYRGVISDVERSQLASNHIKSYLIRVYLRLLTGVDLSEDGFYVNDDVADVRVDQQTLGDFKKLIETRVSRFIGRKVSLDELRRSNTDVDDLLQRISGDSITTATIDSLGKVFEDASKSINIEIGEDLLTFVKTFGVNSILFGAGARRSRVVSPKLFERIFTIPIDPDDFEIDRQLTLSTQSGRAFMNSQLTTSLLRPFERGISSTGAVGFNQTRRRELGDISLQQFFVAIEPLPIVSATSVVSVPRGSNSTQTQSGGFPATPSGAPAGPIPASGQTHATSQPNAVSAGLSKGRII